MHALPRIDTADRCRRTCRLQQGRGPAGYTVRAGSGEIMTLTQMRHAKLWFAGEAGCNACHQAMKFGFNVVQRPASNFSNQNFAPATDHPTAP